MTYGYENLDAERFQKLCQAILTTTHRDVQCLPTGQPDGGRDAFIREQNTRYRKDAIVFQVKFSKDPSLKDERIVIDDLIKSESAKIASLKKNGLKEYFLLTNVTGTSHYEVGSIDKINTQLSKAFGIPSYCWWRDDIDRRIDANASIKWSYPDIIRGSDLLQFLYEGRFGGEETRRLNAIRAYLSYQHKYDSQLKFKQVDLEKGLVDLFVDVPAAALGPSDPRDREKWRAHFERSPVLASLTGDDHRRHRRDGEDRIGAVRALVEPTVTATLPRVVIEGAPGQGKSTVTQFLCQLHRISLLKKSSELQRVPQALRPSDVRLPLRVDLRDYATWLSGRSPFHDNDNQGEGDLISPALETFLAAQISAQSGGLQFSADDLLAFAANSALLIVLDGFDEVADISTRNRLVREISDATTRFDANAISNQVIVTSRPAAFANSPGFPRDEWQYIQILPLTHPVINAYTDKWMSGHNLDDRERREIKRVLSDKLEYPHVRELARNPMQLAILLALISTQGASLPDKRTTLYDRYIDIFFNRESEKSKVVRDKRELLIDMHRYLAWTLQVEAESDAKAGNISETRLREVLRAYLTEMGHDATLVDDLFAGMVERVVALVSRVQGTFEFEVQPLREYFAARYLYDTSPHVQAGSRKSGSIMDRFDALARNAYWLNVTRFYCGCYNSGELPSLVDGLMAIGQSEQYIGTSYATDLSMTLLGDYVFSQQPRSVDRLTDFLFTPDKVRLMLAKAYEENSDEADGLPEGSGRAKLLDVAIKSYKTAIHFDTAFASANIVKENIGSRSTNNIWNEVRHELPPKQALFFGGYLDIIESIDASDLRDMVEKGGSNALRTCVYRNRLDVLNNNPELWRQFVENALDGPTTWLGFSSHDDAPEPPLVSNAKLILALITALSGLRTYGDIPSGRTLLEVARRYGYSNEANVADVCKIDANDFETTLCKKHTIITACSLVGAELAPTSAFEKAVSAFLHSMVEEFGCRSYIIDAAIETIEWLSQSANSANYTGFLLSIANMRSSSTNIAWWLKNLSPNNFEIQKFLAAKIFLTWADEEVLTHTVESFSALVDRLSPREFASLYSSRSDRGSVYPPTAKAALKPRFSDDTLKAIGARAAALLAQRVDEVDRDKIFIVNLVHYCGDDENIIDARINSAWHYADRNLDFWPSALKIIADGYARSVTIQRSYGAGDQITLPSIDAKAVTSSPELYPLTIVNVAERTLLEKTSAQVIPVGSVAARDEWFSQ